MVGQRRRQGPGGAELSHCEHDLMWTCSQAAKPCSPGQMQAVGPLCHPIPIPGVSVLSGGGDSGDPGGRAQGRLEIPGNVICDR